MTLRTPRKCASEIERVDASAVPAPPSQPRTTRARRRSTTKPLQPESDLDDEDSSARSACVAPAAVHTPRSRARTSIDAAAAPPAASPSRSSVAAQLASHADASTEDGADALHASPRFHLLRSALLLVIFLLLYTLTQRYLLEPTFQPHRTEGYRRAQDAKMRAQIAANVCPAGQECEYDLNQDFKLARQRGGQ